MNQIAAMKDMGKRSAGAAALCWQSRSGLRSAAEAPTITGPDIMNEEGDSPETTPKEICPK
jgi:hypothetical protein